MPSFLHIAFNKIEFCKKSALIPVFSGAVQHDLSFRLIPKNYRVNGMLRGYP